MSNKSPTDIRKGIDELVRILRTRSVREWLARGDLPPPSNIDETASCLEGLVYTQVPKPWPLLPAELAECVRDQVVVHMKNGNHDLNFERLLSVVESRCDYREHDFSIIMPLPILRWAKEAWPVDLVIFPSGIHLEWHGLQREFRTIKGGTAELKQVQSHFRLWGYCSTGAVTQAAESVSRLLRALCPIMFSYELFNTDLRLNNLLGPECWHGGSAMAVESNLRAAAEQMTPEVDPIQAEANEQVISLSSDVRGVMGHVAKLIESVYLPMVGKNTSVHLERRLANAVELIICASEMPVPSVGMALYVASIEALVCSKEEGIAEELSNNCATLLLADATARIAAIKAIKKLYGVRSKALHGDQLDAASSHVTRAQELCGAVLTAILEWQAFHERLENATNRQALLDAINEARITGRPLTGIPERLEAGLDWVKRVESSGTQAQQE